MCVPHIHHPVYPPGASDDDEWGTLDDYDPVRSRGINWNEIAAPPVYEDYSPSPEVYEVDCSPDTSPDANTPVSLTSPELSPSEDSDLNTWLSPASPELSPFDDSVEEMEFVPHDAYDADVVDLVSSDDDVPSTPPRVEEAAAPFDEAPRLFMMHAYMQVPRRDLWCYHCGLQFQWIDEAIRHWESSRHRRMVKFARGKPMFFCTVCNRVPAKPYRHEMSHRHIRRRRRLNLNPHPYDVVIRQVRLCPIIGMRRAYRLP
jgi:hypothetical protein